MAIFCWEIRKLSQSEQSCKLILSYARSCCAGEILWWWCLCMNHYPHIIQAVWLPSWICFAVDLCDQGPVKVGFWYIRFFFCGTSEFLIPREHWVWGDWFPAPLRQDIQQRSLLKPAELQGFRTKMMVCYLCWLTNVWCEISQFISLDHSNRALCPQLCHHSPLLFGKFYIQGHKTRNMRCC